MDEVISIIYDEIKKRCMAPTNVYGMGAWDHHIKLVYEIAMNICDEYGANRDIVALSALLHDIALVTNKEYTEEHHICGAQIARELLDYCGLEEAFISKVEQCILHHRGSRLVEKTSAEEICLADADAMAHFYSVPSLLKMVYVDKKMGIDEGATFVLAKLSRSYNKLSEKGKELVLSRYEASKMILDNEIVKTHIYEPKKN